MIRTRRLLAVPACVLLLSSNAFAQLPKSNTTDGRVVVGGIHVRPTSVEAHKKFWVDTLGGTPTRLANNYAAMFPDGIVEMSTPSFGCPQAAAVSGAGTCEQKPWGGTKGTIINHVGFSVRDLRGTVDRVKAAGYPIVTRTELPPEFAKGEKDGIAFRTDHKANVSLVMGPDDILVELVEASSQKAPIVFHHVHFEAPEVAEMIAWYTRIFGARPGAAGSSEAALPGAVLTFSQSADVMVPTRGRVLDHLVFEVRDLDSYVQQLKDRGIKFHSRYAKPNLPLWGEWRSVFLPDPWGTYLELTEGAHKVHALPSGASAQLTPAKDDRIIFGHLHLHPSSLDAHKKFWNETLGGVPTTFGNNIGAVKFPAEPGSKPLVKGLGHTLNLTSASYTTPPTGGTKGTTVHHAGFGVPDLPAALTRVKAAGYPIVTRAELPPPFAKDEKDGIAFRADHNARVAMIMGPDDILVELVEVPSQMTPFAMHHIHFASPDAPEMAAWYERVFGARRGTAGSRDSNVYLANMTFETVSAPVVGTKGRALDHIGFEVRDLDLFVKELQDMGIKLDRPPMKANLPDLGPIGVVNLTDPWGTYIELNEGYRAVR